MENIRKREVNIEKLSDEQLKRVQDKIWEKIQFMVDGVVRESNNMLKIYGAECLMEIKIDSKENIQKLKEKRNQEK